MGEQKQKTKQKKSLLEMLWILSDIRAIDLGFKSNLNWSNVW